MKSKRKFVSTVGTYRPACGGACLIDHADGDMVYLTYIIVYVQNKVNV